MPYYVTLSGGTDFELDNSFGSDTFQLSPTNGPDATLYPQSYKYVKPVGGVSTPAPEELMYRFTTSDLTRDTSYHTLASYNWNNGVRLEIVYRLYWYQGERWGFPSFDLRMRLYQNNVIKFDGNIFNTSGGADFGYGCLIIGFTSFERFVINEAVSYNMSWRVQLTLGADTIVRAEEEAIEKYNITYAAGYGSTTLNGSAQHLVFTKAWLDSVAPGADPEFKENGYYYGPIDGGRVPYEAFRRGINYLRNIDIYDMTYSSHADNAAFPKNNVGSIPYNGVEFSYPYIKFKAKTDKQFTHCATASWSQSNRPVIYKVVNYKEIGNNLAEYTVMVDGLKTFFQYHRSTNPYIIRHTNSANWNKWVHDSVPYKGTYTDLRTPDSTPLSRLIAVVINNKYIYAYTETGFATFCDRILAANSQAKIIPQISACYMLPINLASQTLFTAVGQGGETMHLEPPTELPAFSVDYKANAPFGTTTFQVPWDSIITDQSALYDSKATLHLPGYGDVSAPLNFLIDFAKDTTGNNSRAVRYRISLLDGTISASVTPFHQWSPSIALPQISIPFNSEAVQMYNVNRNQQAGVGTIIGGAFTGGIAGLMTGNPLGAVVGAAIGGYASYDALNKQSDAQRDIIANSQGLQNASCTGAASMADMHPYLSIVKPELAVSYEDYYSVIGYPVQRMLDDCLTESGDTFWPVFSRADLSDKKEIVDDLLARAAEGIYWNP